MLALLQPHRERETCSGLQRCRLERAHYAATAGHLGVWSTGSMRCRRYRSSRRRPAVGS